MNKPYCEEENNFEIIEEIDLFGNKIKKKVIRNGINNERINWNILHTTKHGKVQNNSRIGFSGLSETKIWQNSKEQIRDYINECPLEKIQPAIIAYDLGMYEHYVAKIV